MGGISMRTQTDAQRGQAVGSVIHMSGRMWGVDLALQESVVERLPTRRKVWETLGEPVLVVIGRYRMGFDIRPTDGGAYLRVWIDFDPPTRWNAALAWTDRRRLLCPLVRSSDRAGSRAPFSQLSKSGASRRVPIRSPYARSDHC
jgi:hypothetical protein